jgi:uncharacterized protein (DUF1697 family)
MKYFAFLKGVNVGGHNKVEMKLLPEALQSKDINNVSTYLNSGNILLESPLKSNEIAEVLRKKISDTFKVDTAIFVLNVKQVEDILSKLPFTANENDKSKQLVYFLSDKIDVKKVEAIKNDRRIVESVYSCRDRLYVYYSNGVGRSLVNTNYIDKVLNTESTGRNINTIEKILKAR